MIIFVPEITKNDEIKEKVLKGLLDRQNRGKARKISIFQTNTPIQLFLRVGEVALKYQVFFKTIFVRMKICPSLSSVSGTFMVSCQTRVRPLFEELSTFLSH